LSSLVEGKKSLPALEYPSAAILYEHDDKPTTEKLSAVQAAQQKGARLPRCARAALPAENSAAGASYPVAHGKQKGWL
jgi:hypothetical protein